MGVATGHVYGVCHNNFQEEATDQFVRRVAAWAHSRSGHMKMLCAFVTPVVLSGEAVAHGDSHARHGHTRAPPQTQPAPCPHNRILTRTTTFRIVGSSLNMYAS